MTWAIFPSRPSSTASFGLSVCVCVFVCERMWVTLFDWWRNRYRTNTFSVSLCLNKSLSPSLSESGSVSLILFLCLFGDLCLVWLFVSIKWNDWVVRRDTHYNRLFQLTLGWSEKLYLFPHAMWRDTEGTQMEQRKRRREREGMPRTRSYREKGKWNWGG